MTNLETDRESLTVVASVACARHAAAVRVQNRDQIDNVLLLAVLAAGAKYNIGTQSDEWYRTFDDTIQTGAEWAVEAGVWKRVTRSTDTFDLAEILPAGTAAAENALLAVRAEHYPLRGALRFGAIAGKEAAVLCAVSDLTARPGTLSVVLGAVAFVFKSDLPVDDPLATRPWVEVADAFLRVSKYSIDTTEPGYDTIQERIKKALGDRVKKYLYRTPIE
ncbi:hypothetical protein [Alloactinosynnema sp. L-07]|uniref:hypothetical protein n=1 Tax=Alloactinosynnema sp. L-07 TaxID=1653480 RepID=UPI0012F997A9|nr:hypothetical protein [Alloactinosynnema sp. L-07]